MSEKWKSIVVGETADGKLQILLGLDATPDAQRAFVSGIAASNVLPKGLVRVELVKRFGGVVKSYTASAGETKEEAVTREVRTLSHEAILKELGGGTKATQGNKAKAEAALIKQRLAGKAEPSGTAADPGEEPPVMGG